MKSKEEMFRVCKQDGFERYKAQRKEDSLGWVDCEERIGSSEYMHVPVFTSTKDADEFASELYTRYQVNTAEWQCVGQKDKRKWLKFLTC